MKKPLHGGDIYRNNVKYDFSTNINPLGTPQSVLYAMKESLNSCSNYPDVNCEKLRDALALYEKVSQNAILCGNGAAELIFSLAFAVKPKKALIQAPTFAEYEQALRAQGCEIEYFYTKKESDFKVTREILNQLDEELDMIFLCSPNNPTGIVIDSELLNEICDTCKKNDIIIVVDECFQEFLEKKESIIPKISENENIVILKAFTKIYALAGIRLGYLVTYNEEIITKIQNITQPWNVSLVAQAAGQASLKETEFVKKTIDYITKGREALCENLNRLNFKVYPSKANYILFEINEMVMGIEGKTFYEQCLEKGILIRDCSNYVGMNHGFYRIAVRTTEENNALIKVFEELVEKNDNRGNC